MTHLTYVIKKLPYPDNFELMDCVHKLGLKMLFEEEQNEAASTV